VFVYALLSLSTKLIILMLGDQLEDIRSSKVAWKILAFLCNLLSEPHSSKDPE